MRTYYYILLAISMPIEIISRAAEIAYSLAWAEMEYIGSDKVIYLQNLPEMPVIVIPCPRFGL